MTSDQKNLIVSAGFTSHVVATSLSFCSACMAELVVGFTRNNGHNIYCFGCMEEAIEFEAQGCLRCIETISSLTLQDESQFERLYTVAVEKQHTPPAFNSNILFV